MNKDLRFCFFTVLSFIMIVLTYDLGMIRYEKALIKDTLDLSTKAAALQLDEDSTKIGQGIFDIDVDKAKKVNEDIIVKNLNNEFYNLVVDTEVINVHTPIDYNAPNGKTFKISDPTIFCVVKCKYKNLLFNGNVEVYLLSGSTLKNKNNLKNIGRVYE